MTGNISRRRALTAGGAALGAAVLAPSFPGAANASAASHPKPHEETRTLKELYRDAQAEGGKLVIYAGGDVSSQADGVRAGFRAQFPKIDLTVVTDYSKFHDVRIDNQLATGTLVPDLVQLQTVQDFTRWKSQGKLLPYKPAGFGKVHPAFKDADGAWVAIMVIAFSYMYNTALTGAHAPKTPHELVDPRWKGRIASTYPHDDDAALYLYSLYTRTYGWDWIAKLAAQDIQFNRGSHTAGLALTNGEKAVGVGGSGSLAAPSTNPVRWVAAKGHPFMSWGQRAAILAGAKHPTAAKLYLNWQLSKKSQQAAFTGWSVRTDVTPAGGLRPIWQYPNGHLDGFPAFMADRAAVERWKQTFALYFGEVKGDPSPGWLGLHPGK